jgi:hypothetical protein
MESILSAHPTVRGFCRLEKRKGLDAETTKAVLGGDETVASAGIKQAERIVYGAYRLAMTVVKNWYLAGSSWDW